MVNDRVVLERVQELTWALLDEQITDDELSFLDALLLGDEQARKRFIQCVQLHFDMLTLFSRPVVADTNFKVGAISPVLGFLNAGTPPLGFDLPPAEDVKS